MQVDMIIEMGLTPATTLEIKDQRNAGEKWEYLKKRFLKSSSTKKMMKLMRIFTSVWDESKHDEKEFYRVYDSQLLRGDSTPPNHVAQQ